MPPKQPKQPKPTLRDIPPTSELLQHSATQQRSQKVSDRDANGYERVLPDNETLVMALNELAAKHGRGFFYYLPFREAWKKFDVPDLFPKSRVPLAPGYPDIVYINYVWSKTDQARFTQDPQRARYLKCNALISPPPDGMPLYAVQYIGYSSCPTYTTPRESLVVFANDQTYYFATTTQLKHALGPWDKSHKPSGPDPEARLNQPPGMWKKDASSEARRSLQDLEIYKLQSPLLLYTEITRRCRPMGDVAPTFTAGELRAILPRPEAPEPGTPLGQKSVGRA